MTAKKQTATERLQAHAMATLMGKSDLIGVEIVITGKVLNPEGLVEEVDLGVFSAPPREFSSTSRGFYLNGKVNDVTATGQVEGTRYQVGCNIIAIGSKEW